MLQENDITYKPFEVVRCGCQISADISKLYSLCFIANYAPCFIFKTKTKTTMFLQLN